MQQSHLLGLKTFSKNYRANDFVRAARRPPAQTGLMTETKLAALIRAGYGNGHFERYKPWLRVTKFDYSPVSAMGHLPAPDLRRLHHFRSMAERKAILVTKWIGAVDVRDAFPLWPWVHEHPAIGLPGSPTSRQVRGLEAVAQDLQIRHGLYRGTSLPYVATIDLMATWVDDDGAYRLVGIDCKPKDILDAADVGARLRQRIVLMRRYCIENDIRHVLAHPELLPKYLPINLDALYPRLGPGQLKALQTSREYSIVVDGMRRYGYDMPACEAVAATAAKWGIDRSRAQLCLTTALWLQDIDHDLTEPLELWSPLVRGGLALKRQLARDWLGASR